MVMGLMMITQAQAHEIHGGYQFQVCAVIILKGVVLCGHFEKSGLITVLTDFELD